VWIWGYNDYGELARLAVSNSGNCVLRVTRWQLDSATEHVPDAPYYDRVSGWLGTWVAMLHSKRFFLMRCKCDCMLHQKNLFHDMKWQSITNALRSYLKLWCIIKRTISRLKLVWFFFPLRSIYYILTMGLLKGYYPQYKLDMAKLVCH